MGVHHHGMVPVEAAQTVGTVRIDAHLVEHIGADHHFAGSSAQHVHALVEIHLHLIILGPVFDGMLHGDAVADVAKGTVEFFLLLRGQDVTINLDIHFALFTVIIEKSNIINELLIFHLMPGKVTVLIGIDTLHGNVDPVKSRINDLQTPLGSQQGCVGGGIHPENLGRLLSIAHHIGKPGIYQRFTLLIQSDHLYRIREILKTVDDAFVNFKVHRAMSPALGFLHQFQIPGGAEFTAEIAGIAGVDVDHIGGSQGQGIFQFDAIIDVDSGNGFGFHGTSPLAIILPQKPCVRQ